MKHKRTKGALIVALLLIVIIVAACSSVTVLTAPNNPILHRMLANQHLLSGQTCLQANNLPYYLEFNQSCMPNDRPGPNRPLDAFLINIDDIAHRAYYAFRGIK